MKAFRLVLGMVATFTLAFSGASAAKANNETLSLAEFQASPGYQLLSDEEGATSIFLSNASGVKITTTSSTSMTGTPAAGTILQLVATKTKSQASLANTDGGFEVGTPLIGTFDGAVFYSPVSIASTLAGVINFEAAIARLNNSPTTVLAMPADTAPSSFSKYTPAQIYSGAQLDPLAQLEEALAQGPLSDVAGLQFSPVTSAPTESDPTSTDYVFSAVSPVSGQTPAFNWNFRTTFNANHVLVSQSLTAYFMDISMSVLTTLETPASPTFVPIDTSHSVALSALVTMGRKIAAENSLAAKAKSLATKAAALAKSTRKALTVIQLKSAAKTLKLSTVALKTGVKLTAKFLGVAGSVCVTAVKGKAVTAHC